MLKIKVTEKTGASIEYCGDQSLIARLSAMGHGQPERWIPASEPHDPADVIESEAREIAPAMAAVIDENGNEVSPAVGALMEQWVKLKAEYTVEIVDVSAEYALAEVIAKRKAEYPSPEEFLNAYFDGGDAAVQLLNAKRQAVKAKYPKPGA